MSLLRSSIEKTIGFPSKSAYFAFWKKLFLFDVVANVARVGGSLLLYVFAPNLYQMLPAGLVGWFKNIYICCGFRANFVFYIFQYKPIDK